MGITRARRCLYLSHAWVAHPVGPDAATTSRAASWPRSPPSWSATSGRRVAATGGPARAAGPRIEGGRPAAPWRAPGRRAGDLGVDDRRRAARPDLRAGHRAAARAPRGSTGAEALELQPGDTVVHDHWGPGVVLNTKGEGDRAQARVRFAGVGEKNLLLSATPLRRA